MGMNVGQKVKQLDSVTTVTTTIPELYETEPLCAVQSPAVMHISYSLEEDESLGRGKDEERSPNVLSHALHERANCAACARDDHGTGRDSCPPQPVLHFVSDVFCQRLIAVATVDNSNANSSRLGGGSRRVSHNLDHTLLLKTGCAGVPASYIAYEGLLPLVEVVFPVDPSYRPGQGAHHDGLGDDFRFLVSDTFEQVAVGDACRGEVAVVTAHEIHRMSSRSCPKRVRRSGFRRHQAGHLADASSIGMLAYANAA